MPGVPAPPGTAASGTTSPPTAPTTPGAPTTPTTTATNPDPTTAPTTAPAPTTTRPPATGVDACPTIPARLAPDPARPRYAVTMTADPRTGTVTGRQDVVFTPDLPVDTLVLRLWANGPRPARAGTSIEIGAVTEAVGGRSVARAVDRPDPTTMVVRLGRWVEPGRSVTVTIPWTLRVGGPANDRIARDGESLRLGSFLPLLAWEAGRGWAVEPPTSGFAEATTSPVADWSLRIEAPDGFGVVASGRETAAGTWTVGAARDVAVAVGRFRVERAVAMAPHAVDVVVAVHDGIDAAGDYLGQLIGHLETFAGWYGPYPWDTYQLSITPGLSGGIEYPMHVLQGPATDGRTTPHEVAHMWFYGLAGNNQGRDPWLDEGLATFAEGLRVGSLAEMRSRSIPADGRGRADAPMTYWEGRASSYYRSVYVQTAAALSRIGDPALVNCALAHYVATTAHGIATPDDLARSLDATFGTTDWRAVVASAGLP